MRRKLEAGLVLAIVAWAVWTWVGRRDERQQRAQAEGQLRASDETWTVDTPVAMLAAAETGFAGRVVAADGALTEAVVCATPDDERELGTLAGRVAAIRCEVAAEDGRYRLVGLTPGAYRVSASAAGWLPVQHRAAPMRAAVLLQRGELREGLDFSLGLRGEAVRGVVRDLLGGTIAGAVIADDRGGVARSDDAGRFTLWAPAQATTIVRAAAAGYAGEDEVVRPPQSAVVFTLSPESVLRGVVVRAEGGGPLVGLDVQVAADAVVAVSGEDGGFEVHGLEAGGRRPFVRSEGWCGEAPEVTALGPGETSELVTIAARRCARVRAEVRVKGREEGCAGAQIELLDAAGDAVRRAQTDKAGRAELSGVEPGAYAVRVRCPGALQRAPEPWLLGEETEVQARWEVEPGRTIRGVVVDAGGAAVPRANLELVGPFGYVGADADDAGNFVIEGAAPGENTLRPYHARHSRGEALVVTVAEDVDPAPVRLRFAEDAAIHGVVRARGGGELPVNLTVVARARDNFGARAVRVGEDGRYVVPGVGRLAHRVVVQRANGVKEPGESGELVAPVEVDLAAGDATVDFEVEAATAATLAGRVEDAEGAGEVDAVVTVSDGRVRERALTDEDGRFVVTVEAGGEYRVTATSRAGARVQAKEVAPGAELVLKIAATRRVCGEVTADSELRGRYALRVDGAEVAGFEAPNWCLEVPVGTHSLAASSASLGVAEAKLKVPAQGEVPALTLHLPGRGTVRGRVEGADGAPRAGVRVWAFDASGRLIGGHRVSDAAGEFTVPGAPGEVTVVALRAGSFEGPLALLARGVKVTVKDGATATVVVPAP